MDAAGRPRGELPSRGRLHVCRADQPWRRLEDDCPSRRLVRRIRRGALQVLLGRRAQMALAAFGLRRRLDRPLPRISPPAALAQEEPAKEGGLRTPKHDNDDLPDRHKAPPSLSTLGEIDLTADEFHPSARSNANADARSRAPDRNHALIQLRSPACRVTRLWRWRARYRLVARGCSGRRCRTNAGVRLRAIPLREGRSDRAA